LVGEKRWQKKRERKADKAAQIILHQRQPHQLVFSEDDGVRRHIARDHTICPDDAVVANRDTFQNGDVTVDFYIFPNDNWRCIEFVFVPDVFWFCIESVVVVVEFAAFCDTCVVAQFDFIQTVDGDIMTEIHVIPKDQCSAISDSDSVMISPDHIFPDRKCRIIVQLKSRCFSDSEVRMKFHAGVGIENTVGIKFFDFNNRFGNDIECFIY